MRFTVLMTMKPNHSALLLVLSMGRRKFYMGSKQHGRNMIISEYIWLRWLATLPPETAREIDKVNEKLPDEHKDKHHPMFRKRKQVSSHIQVLKGFFKLNWACESPLDFCLKSQ